jgi:hypothetical protein
LDVVRVLTAAVVFTTPDSSVVATVGIFAGHGGSVVSTAVAVVAANVLAAVVPGEFTAAAAPIPAVATEAAGSGGERSDVAARCVTRPGSRVFISSSPSGSRGSPRPGGSPQVARNPARNNRTA